MIRAFSRDVTVSLKKGTAAILVFLTNPSGTELYSCVAFCFVLVEKRAH